MNTNNLAQAHKLVAQNLEDWLQNPDILTVNLTKVTPTTVELLFEVDTLQDALNLTSKLTCLLGFGFKIKIRDQSSLD